MRHVGILLALIALLSGCIAGDAQQPLGSSQAPVASGPAQYDETTGAIEGLVTDEEIAPVAGAIAGLLELPEKVVQTDEQGRFAFSSLVPGVYTVAVQKLGYESSAQKLDVVAGQTTPSKITLAVLPIEEPWAELIIDPGVIENGVGVVRTATCTNCGNTDEASYHFPDGALPEDWMALKIEVSWQTSDYLGIDFVDRNDDDAKAAVYWRVRSASPVSHLVLRGGDYTMAPFHARTPMPTDYAAFDGDEDDWFIEDWYVGGYQQETHNLDTVCSTDIPNPTGGANILNGYKAGCYGAGFVPELRFTNYITIFHMEVPGDAESYSAIPDA